MKNKISYMIEISDLSKNKLDSLLKLKTSTDNRVIYVDIHSKELKLKDLKSDILYTAKIDIGQERPEISNIKKEKNQKISEEEKKYLFSLLPEFILECIFNFNYVDGKFFFKVLHPIKVKLQNNSEIQLDMYLIVLDDQIFILIEPVNYDNPEENVMIDLHEIKVCEYTVLSKELEELELEIGKTKEKLAKIQKYIPAIVFVFNHLPNFSKKKAYNYCRDKYKSYMENEFQKILPNTISFDSNIFQLLVDYFNVDGATISCINNYFIFNLEDAPDELLSKGDNKKFAQYDGVQKIISPYYNISIYEDKEEYDEHFLANTFEGLLILSVFSNFKSIYDSNEIDPHKISQQLGLRKVLVYENLSPVLYEFYENIKSLKQFKRIEEKLELKYMYSKSLYDEKMILYQRKYNRNILFISICSLFVAILSFYFAYNK